MKKESFDVNTMVEDDRIRMQNNIKKMHSLNDKKLKIEDEQKALRAETEEIFAQYGVTNYTDAYYKIHFKDDSTKRSTDLDGIQKAFPEIWDKVLRFVKFTTVKSGYSWEAK